MEVYSRLRRRRGRARHNPRKPSCVLCLSRDSYPTGTVVGAVINVDSVAAGILSAPKDVYALPDCKNSSAVAPVKCDVGTALHSEISVALVCDGPMPCNKIFNVS